MKEEVIHTAPGMYSNGEYLSRNTSWHVSDSPFKAAQVVSILQKNCADPKTFVEVGCGAGAILQQLSLTYPAAQFDGYDISPQASMINKDRESSNVRFYNEDFLQTSSEYDVLLCMDVFEHIEDYMGFVRALSKRAERLVFHIPMEINVVSILRGNMLVSREQVGHLHYFNRETAIATLGDCGLEVIDYFYTQSFRRLPRKSFKNRVTGFIYNTVFNYNQDLAVKLFGDCSLIVLTRPTQGLIVSD